MNTHLKTDKSMYIEPCWVQLQLKLDEVGELYVTQIKS